VKVIGEPRIVPVADGYTYPIDLDSLEQFLAEILLVSKVSISFVFYENTSDVLIASSEWDFDVDHWSLSIVASRNAELADIQQALRETGLQSLKDWFTQTHEYLHAEPDVWSYNGITFRFEHGQLICVRNRGARAFKRPPPQWWTKPEWGG
jgi:hypothetical protein